MYLDSNDYQTVWRLAHNWVDADPDQSNPDALSDELKNSIHRLIHAAMNRALPSRTKRFVLLMDDSFLSLVFDFHHFRKFRRCLRADEFDKAYLESIYLKRGDVLRWCQSEFLAPPPIWQVTIPSTLKSDERPNELEDDADDDKDKWYEKISERRKQRITCLEIAKQLWKENPELSYREVYSHPTMTRYGYGASFTFETFKKWARPFASEYAKQGGKK